MLPEQTTEKYADNGNVWGIVDVCRKQAGKRQIAAEAYARVLHVGVWFWDLDIDLNPNDIMVKIAGFCAQAGFPRCSTNNPGQRATASGSRRTYRLACAQAIFSERDPAIEAMETLITDQ